MSRPSDGLPAIPEPELIPNEALTRAYCVLEGPVLSWLDGWHPAWHGGTLCSRRFGSRGLRQALEKASNVVEPRGK